MGTLARKPRTTAPNVVALLKDHLKNNDSINRLAWVMLGGKSFMPSEPSSSFDFLRATEKGIPKLSVINLAAVLNVPMKDMATLLNLSYKTLGRKKRNDTLDTITSSLSIEIANTVSKGLSVFEDSDKFNRWLHKENRALKGQRPFYLLNTPTGINLVNQVLGRIEAGVYT
ncbi:MAG TPA: antitoxin Xre/MbcA/ParS toxin-binding domain-containing protein [Chitinophagaceae bacterium]